MSGRPIRETGQAVAYLLRTGCTQQQAADKYGVNIRTVRRALAKLPGYTPAPRGRPAKRGGNDAPA